jgi:hypothetical protein
MWHRGAAAEQLARAGAGVVAGVETAAALHGLPVLGTPPRRVELLVAGSGGGRVDARRRLRALPLDSAEVAEAEGLPVTTVARTVFDLAATRGPDVAVVVADAALRRGLCSLADVEECVRRHPTRQGLRGVRFVLAYADGRSRSPATSLSRLAMWRYGRVPAPDLDVVVHGFSEDVIGTGDFSWDWGQVLGVVDDGPQSAELITGDAEAELGQLGVRVLRWGTEEIARPYRLFSLLHEALDLRTPRAWRDPDRAYFDPARRGPYSPW